MTSNHSTQRRVVLPAAAAAAIDQILGIVLDSFMGGGSSSSFGAFDWSFDIERVVMLSERLRDVWTEEELRRGDGEDREISLSIEDVALVLDGMAYTEVASADLPWIDMVRWTSDFVTAQLRSPWTDDEWNTFAKRGV